MKLMVGVVCAIVSAVAGQAAWADGARDICLMNARALKCGDATSVGAVASESGEGCSEGNPGELEKIVTACTDFIKANPQSPDLAAAYYQRAVHTADISRKLDDLNRAIGLDPTQGIYFSTRGLTYQKIHDAMRAAEDFRQALELDPYDAVATTRLMQVESAQPFDCDPGIHVAITGVIVAIDAQRFDIDQQSAPECKVSRVQFVMTIAPAECDVGARVKATGIVDDRTITDPSVIDCK